MFLSELEFEPRLLVLHVYMLSITLPKLRASLWLLGSSAYYTETRREKKRMTLNYKQWMKEFAEWW